MSPKLRYNQAYEAWFKIEYPHALADGHYCAPKYPDVKTTNGITTFISNFIKWNGGSATRINVAGRMIGGITVTESGAKFDDRKYITSSTRKGTADLICVIHGRYIAIEIKNALTKDKIRENQVKEKQRIERAGGIYVVISSIELFLQWYDNQLVTKLF